MFGKIVKWIIVLAVLGAGGWWGWKAFSAKKVEAQTVRYRTAPVVRSDIVRTVDATGKIQPIKEVEVGAQVNGKIVKLLVDYNSVVTNGQVVALIDPQVYEANYKSALGELHANQANVKKCEAQLVLAEKTLVRKKKLVDPLQFEMSIQAEDLSGYVPSFGWECEAPKKTQLERLERLGICPDEIESRGKAEKLLDKLSARRDAGLTTPKQIRFLEGRGFQHVGTWEFDAARKLIDRIAANGWKVPYEITPQTYVPEKSNPEPSNSMSWW